jgi:O-antigen/teichoic acid export membrane protein
VGVSSAISKFTAKYPRVRALRRAGFSLIVQLSLCLQLLFLIGVAVAYFLVSEQGFSVWLAVTVSGFSIIPMAFINASRAFLEGSRDFGRLSVLRVIYMPANFLVPAVMVWYNPAVSVNALVVGVVLSKFLEALHYSAWGLKKYVFTGYVSHKKKLLLFGFGKWIGVNSVLGPLFSYSDRFVVSLFISIASLTSLVPATELINRLMVLPMAITGVLFPEFSRSSDRIFEKHAISFEALYLINTLIAVALMSVSHPLIELWLGAGKDDVAVLMILFLVGWPLASHNRVVSTYLQVRGGQRAVTVSAAIVALIYLLVMAILVAMVGIYGAPLAALFRVILINVAYTRILNSKGESYAVGKVAAGLALSLIIACIAIFTFNIVIVAILIGLYGVYNISAIRYVVRYFSERLKARIG